MDKSRGSSLAREILSYLAEHPQAQDSLDGIMQWWLLEREIRRWSVEVRKALTDLVADGLIIERRVTGGETLYQLNQENIATIRAFLEPAASKDSRRRRAAADGKVSEQSKRSRSRR